ncbi:hypothetical protein [Salinisphaera sp. G21_0]|uniref:hypothetical protein n=1 Tax=Salinisphaera sp. G21_0 TaxID=2821094 RepID=UPI001AD965E2|nr:hypothetical protein [Salinisphaera sp. G21_0]MBO9480971.1 hypothetical protein [Salinisphaera sp. G21_0]
MDKITRSNHDYSSLPGSQPDPRHQDLSPGRPRSNSVCLGSFGLTGDGANCTGESNVGDIPIQDRTIEIPVHQPTTNAATAPKTDTGSEDASASPCQDTPTLSPPESPTPSTDSSLYLAHYNLLMHYLGTIPKKQKPDLKKPNDGPQEQKPDLNKPNNDPQEQKSDPRKQTPVPKPRKSIGSKSLPQTQKPAPKQRKCIPQEQKPIQGDMTTREGQVVKEPLENATSAACPSPTPQLIHSFGNVSLTMYSGIQAKNNNCALAAFFMALSNNGALNTLIDEIDDRARKLKSKGKMQDANTLDEFLPICRHFHFDENTNGYIADEGLDRIRTLFKLNNGTLSEPLSISDIIPAILERIYDYPDAGKVPSENFGILKYTQSSLKHKIVSITAGDGFVTINDTQEPVSSLRDDRIPSIAIPEGLTKVVKNKEQRKGPPPSNPPKFVWTVDEYVRGEELAIICTEKHESSTGNLSGRKFEYFGDPVNKLRVMDAEVEYHYRYGLFPRTVSSSFINIRGQQIFVNHKLTGFNKDEPESGRITATSSRWATTLQELIDNWLRNTKQGMELDDCAFKELLPDNHHSPEVLLVTIPNFGTEIRPELEWWKDVSIPTANGKKKDYEVGGVVTIETGHFVGWRKEGNVLHYADSMGNIEDTETIPLVVKMPLTGAEETLQAANNDSESQFDAYCSASRRVANLGKSTALVILTQKPDS